MLVRGFLILRAKRGFCDFDNNKDSSTITSAVSSLPGTVFITSPSSSLVANSSSTTISLCCTLQFCSTIRLQMAAVLMIISIMAFSKFSPLVYGNPWTKTRCSNAQWVKTWDFACDELLDEVKRVSS
ncbi:hypothetical protein M405DRAFT_808317 [Rhizopogon salebrosus TDB-379]|nr:hypothetical protein M405DRAFT_808317 [Rhizopogon salebrosus TDB-379]